MKYLLFAAFIGVYIFLSLGSALQESLTYDENVHVEVGMDAWGSQTFTKDPFSPPLIGEIAAIPNVLGFDRLISSPIPSIKALPARIMIIILSVVLLIGMYVAVKRTIGEPEAIAAAFLFVWEPSILAHNHYVTKDMGFTLFFFLSYVSFLTLVKKFCWKTFWIFTLLTGLMVASKTSALPFFFVSIAALSLLQKSYLKLLEKQWPKLLLAVCLSFFVVWATYFFKTDVVIAKRDDPGRISAKLIAHAQQTNNMILKNLVQFGMEVKIPLGTYLASVKNALLLQRDQSPVFFLGKEYPAVRWYFLPVNWFLKFPIPLLVFLGITLYFVRKKHIRFDRIAPYLAPPIGILLFLSLSGVRPYVRYLLPIYPFLIVISSVGLARMLKKNMIIVPVLLCTWYTIGTLLYFPHFITFANEFSGPRDKRYEKLIDSDIDWGQGLFDVAGYIRTSNIQSVSFSYFGTDDGNFYGLESGTPYGTYKKEEICAFHTIAGNMPNGKKIVLISSSNWYYCGYSTKDSFKKERIKSVLKGTTLVFDQPDTAL